MIYLRELTRSDLPQIHRWRQNKTVVHWLAEPFRYLNEETESEWFDHYQQNRHRQVRLAICLTKTHQHIGNIYLLNIHPVHRTAEISLFIGELAGHNQGHGTQAMHLCLQHAFEELNLNRLYLTVWTQNKPAIKLYEKLGFVKEGVAREAIYKAGKYENLYMYALVKSQWLGR